MGIGFLKLLGEDPIPSVFTVIGLGYPVGRIRIADVQAGLVIGVLLVGLPFGHFGFSAPPGASGFGFALVIFSVAIQAGPGFFGAFAADGLRFAHVLLTFVGALMMPL
jgi:putative transport protein